jgi:hypothetical protein
MPDDPGVWGGRREDYFHSCDLRQQGATRSLYRTFAAPIVMALGGWKTERMMRRYAAVTDATLRAAAEAVSGAEVGSAHDRMAAATGSRPVTH